MRAHPVSSALCLSLAGCLLASLSILAPTSHAFALSEIQGSQPAVDPDGQSVNRIPLPLPGSGNESESPELDEPPEGEDPVTPSATHPRTDADEASADVLYDVDKLPEPVKRMHALILEACKSGDLEKLRPLLGSGDSRTQLTLAEIDGDPIAFLRELAGDDQGQEVLAILSEILEAGFVHLDEGKPEELYVWPYFFAIPLESLTPPQRVELFRILTAGDFEEMKAFGAYVFYRVGITSEGRWSFFVAGD